MTKTGRPAGKTEKLTEIFTRVTPEEKKRLQAAHKQYNKDKGLKLSFSAYLAALVAEEPVAEVNEPTLTEQTYQDNPLWALLPKKYENRDRDVGIFVHPVKLSTSQSKSQVEFRNTVTAEKTVQFLVPNVSQYQTAQLSDHAIASCAKDKHALASVKSLEIDNMVFNAGLQLGTGIFRDGSGCIGTIGKNTDVNSKTLILSNSDDVNMFEIGMELDVSPTRTGRVRNYGAAGHGLYVIGIDRMNGVLTIGTSPTVTNQTCKLNDAVNGIPTIAVGDCLFQRGDANDGTVISNKLFGIEAWIPYGGPQSNDSFCCVNRSIDPVRLAGNWFDATTLSVEDTILKGCTMVAKQGGTVDTIVIPYPQFAQLLCSKVNKITVKLAITPDISIDAIQLLSTTGMVNVIPDRNCPSDRIYGLNLKSWTYSHLAEPVNQFNLDGEEWFRPMNSDYIEARVFTIGNLVCTSPKSNFTARVTCL